MIKKFFEAIIHLEKNKEFRFDENINAWILIKLIFEKSYQLLRGFRIIFSFKKPKLLFLGRGVKLKHLSFIDISDWTYIGDYVLIDGLGKFGISLGKNVHIGSFSRLVVSANFAHLGSHIRFGDNVGLGSFSNIGGSGGVEIGANTIIGQYLSLHPENHNISNPEELIRLQGTTRKEIKIGKNCWLGAKVTVLAGVTIGDNCVIGAGSVVTKDIPENSIAVGNPAKVIGQR